MTCFNAASLLSQFSNLYYPPDLCVRAHVLYASTRGKLAGIGSLSVLWVPGMDLWLSGIAASAFIGWAISRALQFCYLLHFSSEKALRKPKCITFDLKFAFELKAMEKLQAEERLCWSSPFSPETGHKRDTNSPIQATALHWKQKSVHIHFIHSFSSHLGSLKLFSFVIPCLCYFFLVVLGMEPRCCEQYSNLLNGVLPLRHIPSPAIYSSLYFVCVSVLPTCISMHWCPWKPKEGTGHPKTGVKTVMSHFGEAWMQTWITRKSSQCL